MNKILWTSESVSEGHPDKVCDQIADAILDKCLEQDPNTRLACEVFITTNYILIGGEIKSRAKVKYQDIARKVLLDIGYNNEEWGINANTCIINVLIHQQSDDIVLGVERDITNLAAGDQGMVFGYATNETKNYMPLSINIAHDLVKLASDLRKDGSFKWARPDMKSQVTVDYTNNKEPLIDTILMSIQHEPDYDEQKFKKYIEKNIMIAIANKYKLNTNFKILINPAGRFVIGGPNGDSGLTGRKIIVDTYGGVARHGGGAFSGKDATKVDRAGAYMARYVAKNIVAAGLAERCELQIAYGIGLSNPIAIYVDTFKTNKDISNDEIIQIIKNHFDFSISGMIRTLKLTQPIYQQTSVYGHFGKELKTFAWETLDKIEILRQYLDKDINKTK